MCPSIVFFPCFVTLLSPFSCISLLSSVTKAEDSPYAVNGNIPWREEVWATETSGGGWRGFLEIDRGSHASVSLTITVFKQPFSKLSLLRNLHLLNWDNFMFNHLYTFICMLLKSLYCNRVTHNTQPITVLICLATNELNLDCYDWNTFTPAFMWQSSTGANSGSSLWCIQASYEGSKSLSCMAIQFESRFMCTNVRWFGPTQSWFDSIQYCLIQFLTCF